MTARKAISSGARMLVVGSVCLAAAHVCAAPLAPGRYAAEFCTVPSQGEAKCRPAEARLSTTGLDVRAGGDEYRIRFGDPQLDVRVREKRRPPAHFFAEYRWVNDTVLRYRETQPVEWEVRLGARR